MANKARVGVVGLAISAAAFIGLVMSEGFTDSAVIPTKGDRATVGHGSTFWEDGTPVKMGEKITPTRAIQLAGQHISKEEAIFRASIPGVALHQAEYDIYNDWIYQYGTGAWNGSSMRRELIAGNYVAACNALLRYRFAAGYDCSTPGNRRCSGVWTRQLERHAACMAAQ
jgi:GH24 family phage-related lysozyme (muramidase)